jgi:hypothetical protein
VLENRVLGKTFWAKEGGTNRRRENYIMRSFMILCCKVQQMKENEMGRTSGTYGGEEKCMHSVGRENLR